MATIRTEEQMLTEDQFCPTYGPHRYCDFECASVRKNVFKYKSGEPGERRRIGWYCGLGGEPTAQEIEDYAKEGAPVP